MKYGFQRQRILGDAAIFMPLYLWINCETGRENVLKNGVKSF